MAIAILHSPSKRRKNAERFLEESKDKLDHYIHEAVYHSSEEYIADFRKKNPKAYADAVTVAG